MNSEDDIKAIKAKKDVSELVASLGTIISVVNLYGLNHMISVDAMEKSFELLEKNLVGRKKISFNVVDNQLLVNMMPLNDNSNFVARFIERLAILEISGFTFAGGISEDEFIQFIILLTSRDTAMGNDDFNKALDDGGLEHITASKAILREVLEDEDIVKKDDIKSDGDGDGGGYDTETVQQVVAFLKGDVDAAPLDVLQSIEPEENNINKLSELIMNSVSISQRNPDLATGESMGDILVGCLRRTFSTQLKSSSARTKSGRKKISKSLLMMEKSILDKLHNFAAGDTDDLPEQVSTCLGNMRDELKVDGVVSDYLKRQKSLGSSEQELVKLLKNKDTAWVEESGLQKKLTDGGINDSEWNKLVVQSGVVTKDNVAGGESLGTLERVLSDLSKLLEDFDGDNKDPEAEMRISDSLELVSKEVEAVVEHTNDKINELAIGLNKSDDDKNSSNKHEWSLVKEIVQELCQPLSVISCTVDMLGGNYFGDLPPSIIPALELATDSSLRMKTLADRLVEVCGVPVSFSPEPVAEMKDVD